jgi:hypothetical protein
MQFFSTKYGPFLSYCLYHIQVMQFFSTKYGSSEARTAKRRLQLTEKSTEQVHSPFIQEDQQLITSFKIFTKHFYLNTPLNLSSF